MAFTRGARSFTRLYIVVGPVSCDLLTSSTQNSTHLSVIEFDKLLDYAHHPHNFICFTSTFDSWVKFCL